MLWLSRSTFLRWETGSSQEDIAMVYRSRSPRDTAALRESNTLTTVVDYRFLAPARFAAQDRLASDLFWYSLRRDASQPVTRQPSVVRRWLGTQTVRLGTWLSGAPEIRPSDGVLQPAQS
jgi:hypothetical protein